MKLGASYSFWDCEEHLERSIRNIRPFVDFISIVYTEQSYQRKEWKDRVAILDLLRKLETTGMVQKVERVENNYSQSARNNETYKRNVGLELSKKAKCTHHLAMDADEFYEPSKFRYAKNLIEKNDYDSSVCQIVEYWKSPKYKIITPQHSFRVPFIYKIGNNQFDEKCSFCSDVDSTRKIESFNTCIFDEQELVMHHFTYIRNDIRTKLENSSAFFQIMEDLQYRIDYFNNWHLGQPAMLLISPRLPLPPYYSYREIAKTKPLF